MNARWPHIRIHHPDGDLEIRDGLALCFFMRRSHREVGSAMLRAVEAYCRAIAPQRLEWYPDGYMDWLPLEDRGWAEVRRWFLDVSRDASYSFHLANFSEPGGAYRVEYRGRNLEDPEWTREGDVTGIQFQLPTEYLEEHGPAHVRALARKLGAELPFSFGYGSLAFIYLGTSSTETWEQLLEVYERYPGMDMPTFTATAHYMGTRARGAYWLTFLGQPLLGQLGGAEHLRQRLSPSISVESLPGERLLLTLGEWPEAGDTQQGYVPPLYRELAHVLEPFLYEEPLPGGSFSGESLNRWLRRFTAEPSPRPVKEP